MPSLRSSVSVALAMVLAAAPGTSQAPPAGEGEAASYAVDALEPPAGAILEVGGMAFLPDGTLVVATRRGQVWKIANPCASDPKDARFQLFAEGFQDALGLGVAGDAVHVLTRTELVRLADEDGDGTAERADTVAQGWGTSGNYHEFTYGLPRDAAGRWDIATNVGFLDPQWWHGKSLAPWRGWVLSVGADGRLDPVASGFRSPNGIARSPEGELFVTDNQGDWVAACPLFHVVRGRFYGHPASLSWTAAGRERARDPHDREPPAEEPADAAVWLPYGMSRSAAGMAWDPSAGRFGPFGGQLFVAELTNGLVARVLLERVEGEWQGAAIRFRHDVGAANRLAFAPDGTLFAGLTNRGWGGAGRPHGITRIRYTGRAPMDVAGIALAGRGFTVSFTEPLAAACAPSSEDVQLTEYDYNWWWAYGSPETNPAKLEVRSVEVSADRRSLTIAAPALRAGMVARIKLHGLAGESGRPLLHDEIDYTVNRLAGEPAPSKHVRNRVPPPLTREEEAEGWLYLQPSDPRLAWSGTSWSLVDLFCANPESRRFEVTRGWEAYCNQALDKQGPSASDLVSLFAHEDVEVQLQFALPRHGRFRVLFQGRFPLEFVEGEPVAGSPEGIRAGEWQALSLKFRTDPGRRDQARFEEVKLKGRLVGEVLPVEAVAPTPGAEGRMIVCGTRGVTAFRMLRVKPMGNARAPSAWTKVFDGSTLAGFEAATDAKVAVGEGIVTLRSGSVRAACDCPEEVSVRARLRAGDAAVGSLRLGGFEVRVNSNGPDPARTGSIVGLRRVAANLVPAGSWFDLELRRRRVAGELELAVFVNGLEVARAGSPPGPADGALHVGVAGDGPEMHLRSLEATSIQRH